jgi:hypothetical protein
MDNSPIDVCSLAQRLQIIITYVLPSGYIIPHDHTKLDENNILVYIYLNL